MRETDKNALTSPEMLRKGDLLTLAVTDLNNLGCGVGHAPDGRTVFVEGAVAGDVVEAMIIKSNRSYYVAAARRTVSPSPDRREGFCAAPVSCGGCVYRNLSYEKELELKRAYLVHTFRKAGLGEIEIRPVRSTGVQAGYRNKAEYPIASFRGHLTGGFYAKKSHRVVPAVSCSLQPPFFGEILAETCEFMEKRGVTAYDEETGTGLLRHLYLRAGTGSGEIMVCPVVNGDRLPEEAEYVRMLIGKHPQISSVLLNTNKARTNVVLGPGFRTLYGRSYLTDRLCGLDFHIAPDSFYQVNHDAAELLYGLAGELTGLSGRGLLLDLYCGAGTIGLCLSRTAGEVIGVEIVPAAVRCARENARLNGIENASFYCGDAAETDRLLSAAEAERGPIFPDVVILDPPRKGCEESLLRFLAQRRVPRIVYVSCGPESLARDIARLCALGYTADSATPVDLFPRTGHVESIVLLSLKGQK